jgi:hypothetical protein
MGDRRRLEMPQQRRHHPHRVEEPAANAQKAHLQGKSELEFRTAAFLDDPGLLGRELEEHLDLEGGRFARAGAADPVTGGGSGEAKSCGAVHGLWELAPAC